MGKKARTGAAARAVEAGPPPRRFRVASATESAAVETAAAVSDEDFHAGLAASLRLRRSASFEAAFARAVAAGLLSEAESDMITYEIAEGEATEISVLCDWWPAMEVVFGQDFPWQPMPDTKLPQTFSLAEANAHYVHPRWARLKNRGNEALAAGELSEAYTWYSRAIGVCDAQSAITALFKHLGDAAAGSGALRLHAAEDDIAPLLLEHMAPCIRSWDVLVPGMPGIPGGVAMAVEPNLPLATCYANRAAVGLKEAEGMQEEGGAVEELRQSILRDALLDAECAREMCPEYLKGHFRAAQALRALGGRDAEAARLDKATEMFKLGVAHLPWYALALVSIGWLDVISLERVYQPAFQRHVLARIAANSGVDKGVTVFASLVPFSSGQWLCVSLEYQPFSSAASVRLEPEGGRSTQASYGCRKVDGVHFKRVDRANAAALEAPPNGHASSTALEAVPGEVCNLLGSMLGVGLEAASLVMGQGLTAHLPTMRAHMRAAGFTKLVVSRSTSTHASLLEEVSAAGYPEEERHHAAAALGDSRHPGLAPTGPGTADAYAALLADMANIFPMGTPYGDAPYQP